MTPAASLRALRKQAELTQAELAEKAGLKREQIVGFESEKGYRKLTDSPRASIATVLAEILKLSVGEVLVELGAGEEEAAAEYRSLHQSHAELEADVFRLVEDVRRLARQVRALERRVPPGSSAAGRAAR